MTHLPSELDRAMAGDGSAFVDLVDRHCNRLMLFIRRHGATVFSGDYGPEDAFQQVLFRAWELLPQYDSANGDSFYGWLASIARSSLGNRWHYLNRKSRRPPTDVSRRELDSQIADSLTSIATGAARREQLASLERCIAAMEPQRRNVVQLVFIDGLPIRAAADQLGLSKSGTWDRLQAALEELKVGMSS